MTLRTIPQTELGKRLGYLGDDGRPIARAVADLLRAPLARWGLSPRVMVLKHVRVELRAGGVEDVTLVPRVLQHLIEVGECDEVYLGHERYLAPASPRWLPVAEGVAAYLGVAQPPAGLTRLQPHPDEVVRRVRVETDEDAAILEVASVREISLAEWLTPLGYLPYAARRLRRPVRGDTLPLRDFWNLLEASLLKEGLTVGTDSEIRFLTGGPGEFFGRYDSPEPQGRWTAAAPDGLWCAYRRGYGETHWHPCIVSLAGGRRSALDLYDGDEWRWALVARGLHLGIHEVVQNEGRRIQLGFPPPTQLRVAMDLVGTPAGPWQWEVASRAPLPWDHIS